MLREDRRLVESHFESGVLRVICTTATLAWGRYFQLPLSGCSDSIGT